jgi:hypothetical protein
MDRFGLRWRVFFLVAFVAMITMSSVGNQTMAKDGGQFEGAVWKFTMTPKLKKLKTLHGRYRVSKDVFFQRKNGSSRILVGAA